MEGCGKVYSGISTRHARRGLSKHLMRVHKMKMVEYRRKHETPEALEARETLQRQREARRASALRGPDEPLGGDLNFGDFGGADDDFSGIGEPSGAPHEPESPEQPASTPAPPRSGGKARFVTLAGLAKKEQGKTNRFREWMFDGSEAGGRAMLGTYNIKRARGGALSDKTVKDYLLGLRAGLAAITSEDAIARFNVEHPRLIDDLPELLCEALLYDTVPWREWPAKLANLSTSYANFFCLTLGRLAKWAHLKYTAAASGLGWTKYLNST